MQLDVLNPCFCDLMDIIVTLGLGLNKISASFFWNLPSVFCTPSDIYRAIFRSTKQFWWGGTCGVAVLTLDPIRVGWRLENSLPAVWSGLWPQVGVMLVLEQKGESHRAETFAGWSMGRMFDHTSSTEWWTAIWCGSGELLHKWIN